MHYVTFNADALRGTCFSVTLMPSGLSSKKSIRRSIKLNEITKRLPTDETNRQLVRAFERILKSERAVIGDVRYKIVTSLVAKSPTVLMTVLLDFINEDLSRRIELAFAWLYEEYCYCHSFHKVRILNAAICCFTKYSFVKYSFSNTALSNTILFNSKHSYYFVYLPAIVTRCGNLVDFLGKKLFTFGRLTIAKCWALSPKSSGHRAARYGRVDRFFHLRCSLL